MTEVAPHTLYIWVHVHTFLRQLYYCASVKRGTGVHTATLPGSRSNALPHVTLYAACVNAAMHLIRIHDTYFERLRDFIFIFPPPAPWAPPRPSEWLARQTTDTTARLPSRRMHTYIYIYRNNISSCIFAELLPGFDVSDFPCVDMSHPIQRKWRVVFLGVRSGCRKKNRWMMTDDSVFQSLEKVTKIREEIL